MSVIQVPASPNRWGSAYSSYGTANWATVSATIVASIPVNVGTNWTIWQIGVSSIATGEAFNGVTISGSNGFVVPSSPNARVAQLLVNAFNNFNAFNGATGTLMDSYTSGAGNKNLAFTFTKAGFTSTDLKNGNFFLGIAVNTNNNDPSYGPGSFTYNSFSFQLYTGSDIPNPPATAAAGTWTNPNANNNPGALPGASFASLNYRLKSPIPQTFFNMQFQSSNAGILFPNGTTLSPSFPKGTGNDASHLYDSDTGIISVGAGVAPGVYTIRCQTNGGPGVLGGAGLLDYSSLTVRQTADLGGRHADGVLKMRRAFLFLLLLTVPSCTTVYVISGEGNSMERSHEQGDVEVLKRHAVIVRDAPADKP